MITLEAARDRPRASSAYEARSCRTKSRFSTAGTPGFEAGNILMRRMAQASLMGFSVGGACLNTVASDVPYHSMGVLATVRAALMEDAKIATTQGRPSAPRAQRRRPYPEEPFGGLRK
jgi:hypothetical protein